MKTLSTLATIATLTQPVQAQVSDETNETVGQLDSYLIRECTDVGNNTLKQCSDILYPIGVEVGREARRRCFLPRPEYANSTECINGEIIVIIRERMEEILEAVRTPVGEEL